MNKLDANNSNKIFSSGQVVETSVQGPTERIGEPTSVIEELNQVVSLQFDQIKKIQDWSKVAKEEQTVNQENTGEPISEIPLVEFEDELMAELKRMYEAGTLRSEIEKMIEEPNKELRKTLPVYWQDVFNSYNQKYIDLRYAVYEKCVNSGASRQQLSVALLNEQQRWDNNEGKELNDLLNKKPSEKKREEIAVRLNRQLAMNQVEKNLQLFKEIHEFMANRFGPTEKEKEELANKNMKALLAEEQAEKKKPGKQNRNRGRKRPSKQLEIKVAFSPEDKKIQTTIKSVKELSFQNYAMILQKQRPKYKELNRVTKRWQNADCEAIRMFEDYTPNGEKVRRYANLTDEEVLTQRSKHYLPGTELILSNDTAHTIFSFPTSRGAGMLAEMVSTDKEEKHDYGIIYFGLDESGKSKIIYHKQFLSLTELSQTDKEKLINQPMVPDYAVIKAEKKEACEWNHTTSFQFGFETSGLLKISYVYEKYSLIISPVRRDLLHKIKV